METQQIIKLKSDFDDIARYEDGVEFWLARDLQSILGYKTWEGFYDAIIRAETACKNAGGKVEDHFREASKLINIGKNAHREIVDFALTRYACYLTAQNGDPSKDEIAFAQTYFASQTHKAELLEERLKNIHRIQMRDQLKETEKRFSQNIYEHGVDESGFARIRSKGDQALFGHTTAEMKRKFGAQGKPLADVLPPITIAAKNLAMEMTNIRVETENLQGEIPITSEHEQNNSSVRRTLTNRGIYPESLPPEEDIKKVERRIKLEEKRLPDTSQNFSSKK